MNQENYIVSARKYRPETWEGVVGQHNITSTLRNAIANDRIAQAYLFCGPRGVGKTTCARIFARSINGFEPGAETDYAFNIFELDAASNNGVDSIRDIVDQVRIPPQIGKYKVYIIDEVHMLSASAFNAFLKTLEEPPAHAVFILATTEKHKIIPTILSRCQIFDFHRIQAADTAEHLAWIAASENVSAEPEGLRIIAQKADGALRDALSIFDQITAFSGGNVTYKAVIDNLNILDYDYYFRIADAVIQSDTRAILLLLDAIIQSGFDPYHFLSGFSAHLRDLMVAKDPETLRLLDVADSIKTRYIEQASAIDLRLLVAGMTLLNEADTAYRFSRNPRFIVELALIRFCTAAHTEAEKKNDFRALMPFPSARTGLPTTKENKLPGESSQRERIPSVLKPLLKRTPQILLHPTGKLLDTDIQFKNLGIRTGLIDLPDLEPASKVEEKTPERIESFTQEQFLSAWQDYVAYVVEMGKKDLHLALTHEPPIVQGTSVILKLINKTLAVEMNFFRHDLVQHLRNKLRNDQITLEYSFEVTEGSGKYIVSDKEIFDHMATLNPALLSLQIAMGLDFER